MSKILTLVGIFSIGVLLIDNAHALKKVASTTDKEWILKSIQQHNKYRHHHGAPDLVYNETLCEISQSWANELLDKDQLEHNPEVKDDKIGENYYKYEVEEKSQEKSIDAERPVDAWYSEMKGYDFETGEGIDGQLVGHFTQIVWKGSLEMCTSMATKKKDDGGEKVIIVANYWPTGNVGTRYKENVQPYSSSPSKPWGDFGSNVHEGGAGGYGHPGRNNVPKNKGHNGNNGGGGGSNSHGKGHGKGGNQGPRQSSQALLVLLTGFCSIAAYQLFY